jgi:hypothetical protein
MKLKGKRLKRTRLIHKGRYVVAVDVEMIIPLDDPSEPVYDAQTIELFKKIEQRAAKGDVAWLRKVGKVFEEVAV